MEASERASREQDIEQTSTVIGYLNPSESTPEGVYGPLLSDEDEVRISISWPKLSTI